MSICQIKIIIFAAILRRLNVQYIAGDGQLAESELREALKASMEENGMLFDAQVYCSFLGIYIYEIMLHVLSTLKGIG